MSKPLEITGQKYGRLTAVKRVGTNSRSQSEWLFKCDCGNEVIKTASLVKRGGISSCGCLSKERIERFAENYAGANKTHGKTHTRLYRIWEGMKSRCGSTKDYYKWWKDISVCEEWQEFESFYQWAISNGYRDNLTIDRIDNNGNYEPSNCRWATLKTQANNRSSNRYMTYNGVTKRMTEWMREFGKTREYYYKRKNKYTDEEIIDSLIKEGGSNQ